MNSELIVKFEQNYPEIVDGTLDCVAIALCAAFNKYGSVLAVGCNDGTIVIWDFLTRGIIKIIPAHVHPITSIMWSRCNYQLLTSSTDKFVSIWDPITGNRLEKFEFPCQVISAEYNSRYNRQILVSMLKETPVLIEIGVKYQKLPVRDEKDFSLIAKYDAKGIHIYTGNSVGEVLVYNSLDLDIVASFKIECGVKSIEFAKRGGSLLINSADRQIRIYDSNDIIVGGLNSQQGPKLKIQETINNPKWIKCTFSSDGEYICAGCSRLNVLNIWDKTFGNVVKILHRKTGDYLLDVVWHPTHPILASIGSGYITIWAPNKMNQDWSNYLPNFVEIDTNIEYEERESEYDIDDEDNSFLKCRNKHVDCSANEDLDVDVIRTDPVPLYCSSDDDDGSNDIIYKMPVNVMIFDEDFDFSFC